MTSDVSGSIKRHKRRDRGLRCKEFLSSLGRNDSGIFGIFCVEVVTATALAGCFSAPAGIATFLLWAISDAVNLRFYVHIKAFIPRLITLTAWATVNCLVWAAVLLSTKISTLYVSTGQGHWDVGLLAAAYRLTRLLFGICLLIRCGALIGMSILRREENINN